LRKKIASDPKFARMRYLDPAKKGSLRKEYYNPEILSEFDKVYTRKEGPVASSRARRGSRHRVRRRIEAAVFFAPRIAIQSELLECSADRAAGEMTSRKRNHSSGALDR
jgi:hypothetical protein